MFGHIAIFEESENVMRACAPGLLRCDPIIISAPRNSKFEMWQKEVWIQKFTKRHYNVVAPEPKFGQCPRIFAYFFLGNLNRKITSLNLF